MRLTQTRGRLEQRALTGSIAATVLLSATGVVFGAITGSFSILFDGVYSLIDAAMGGVALVVARLVLRGATAPAPDPGAPGAQRARFQFGFWHLEPMALALNAVLLTLAALYALGNALILLASGGRELAFDVAAAYAAVALAACLAMGFWELRLNRLAKSDLVALDTQAWWMSGAISGALLAAFGVGWALEESGRAEAARYADPVVLALVCLAILPTPLRALRKAARDLLVVAPDDLDAAVRAAAAEAVARHGLAGFRSYVARTGRAAMIELQLIAPDDWPPRGVAALDAIRDEIGAAIGGKGPNRWLTIAFTTRLDWAD
jgi:predicted Co/Zn/Cd cation transporter (cation efflux family)